MALVAFFYYFLAAFFRDVIFCALFVLTHFVRCLLKLQTILLILQLLRDTCAGADRKMRTSS